jgi:hypothetical protein
MITSIFFFTQAIQSFEIGLALISQRFLVWHLASKDILFPAICGFEA